MRKGMAATTVLMAWCSGGSSRSPRRWRLRSPRGFETIAAMLADGSARVAGQGIPTGRWTVEGQIRADRYYAAHLLGDLRDRRGADLLVPLLNDDDVAYIAPWSLAEVGDPRAIGPLIARTDRHDPSLRVLAIGALETLKAREALPRLRQLLQDDRMSSSAIESRSPNR